MRLSKTCAAVCLALALGACSGGNNGTTSGSGGTGTTGGSCPQNGVPADVRDVERNGEGLVATTFGAFPDRTPDWGRAATVLSLLKEVWGKAKNACPNLPSAESSELDAAIASLDKAIPGKDQKAATAAANKVGLAVPPIFAYFNPDIPLEVVRMDAVFRQVGIDAHFGDWAAVKADVSSLQTDWTAAKGAVEKRAPTCHRVGGTSTIVGDIDASLKNLETAQGGKDGKATETESENGALEVDTLELLFDCPPDGAAPSTGLGAKCKKTADCGAGLACDTANAGGTCAPDPSVATVGGPCSSTIDCGTDSRSACLTEAGDSYPGGYCAMEPCNDVQVCPAGGTCVSQPHETPGCLQACATDKDCRIKEGYVCQVFPTAPPSGFGPSEKACGFPCKDDAGCTSPLKCDAATGKCKP